MQESRAPQTGRSAWDQIAHLMLDIRFLQAVGQVIFAIILVAIFARVITDIFTALADRNLTPNFAAFESRAGFDISESPTWYGADSSYWQAFSVGLGNTIRVSLAGLVACTVLGVFFGVFLLSNNWLVRTLSRVYVEVLRNTPLLVQLIVWYFIVILALPVIQQAIAIPQEGVLIITARLVIYGGLALFMMRLFPRGSPRRGAMLLGLLVFALLTEFAFAALKPQEQVYTAINGDYTTDQAAIDAAFAQIDGADPDAVAFEAGTQGAGRLELFRTTTPATEDEAGNQVEAQRAVAVSLPVTMVTRETTTLGDLRIERYVAQVPIFGRADPGEIGFWLYVLVSAGLIALAWFLPSLLASLRVGGKPQPGEDEALRPGRLRRLALALSIGQFIAGLLYYFGIMPDAALRTEVYPLMYLSNRGFKFPEILSTARFGEWMVFVGMGLLTAVALWVFFGRLREATGQTAPRATYALLTVLAALLIGWFVVGLEPDPRQVVVDQDGVPVLVNVEEAREDGLLTLEDELLLAREPIFIALPQVRGIGAEVTPEYMALFLGLTIYTSAFVADIVRGGIQAVPYGQVEAARALGFSRAQTLRMIVLPQALRVIIPPMGNQYLNLTKNSSLAVAIAYADLYQISTTVMNQSGQSVTGITVLMLCYLAMSLTISAVMNWINGRFQIVTR